MPDLYALHTATNYDGTPNALRGCLNDWRNFLKLDDHLGIPEENRLSLIGKNFRRSLVGQAADHFVSVMDEGDKLIGSNSSHGTPVDDQDGDEADGKDEAIVTDLLELIRDDDIYKALARFKKGTLLVLWFDNCFAGTMDRALQKQNWHLMGSDVVGNAVAYLGCAENGTSADAYLGSKFNGALTWCSLGVLRDANCDITYLQHLDEMNARLRKQGFGQVAKMAISSESLMNKRIFTM